jgi:hypothetical protein
MNLKEGMRALTAFNWFNMVVSGGEALLNTVINL